MSPIVILTPFVILKMMITEFLTYGMAVIITLKLITQTSPNVLFKDMNPV